MDTEQSPVTSGVCMKKSTISFLGHLLQFIRMGSPQWLRTKTVVPGVSVQNWPLVEQVTFKLSVPKFFSCKVEIMSLTVILQGSCED